MIPCSEDNRTRTYQPRQSVRTPLDYDTQFESELPPEIRAELEAPPAPIKRGPVRPPETEEEIQAAIAWLRSQGYSPPTTSAPVRPLSAPPPPVVQVPTPPRAERVPHRGWGLIWMVLVGVFLWALLHNQGSQPSASRALTEWSFASCILAISSKAARGSPGASCRCQTSDGRRPARPISQPSCSADRTVAYCKIIGWVSRPGLLQWANG